MSQQTEVTMVCDRCNARTAKDFADHWGGIYATIDVGGVKTIHGDKEQLNTADLCPNCSKSLWRWWTNIRE